MNLANVRQDLADLLANLSANVYFFPPEVVMAPAVVIVPDSPYVQPVAISRSKYRARFRLTFAVAMTNNQAALNTLEELIFATYNALPVGYTVFDTTDVRPTNLGQSDLLTAEMVVEVVTEIGN
jgi:hypothetical protein